MDDKISKYLKNQKALRTVSTYTDVIYKNLKEAILEQKLESDQRLKIREIASIFEVSMTPVREAIQRLAAEGYVMITSRGEVKIVRLSQEEMREISRFIQLIDMNLIEDVILNITDSLVDEFEKLHNKLHMYYENGNLDRYTKQNLKIHNRIWKLYGNSYIYHMLVSSVEKTHMSEGWLDYRFTPHFLKKTYNDHCEILKAMKERDVKRAVNALSHHWDPDIWTSSNNNDS